MRETKQVITSGHCSHCAEWVRCITSDSFGNPVVWLTDRPSFLRLACRQRQYSSVLNVKQTVDNTPGNADVASGGRSHASPRPTPLCRLKRTRRLPLYLHVWWHDGWRRGMGYLCVQIYVQCCEIWASHQSVAGSDFLGRTTAFNLTLLFATLFGVVASFMPSFGTLALSLFLLGTSVGVRLFAMPCLQTTPDLKGIAGLDADRRHTASRTVTARETLHAHRHVRLLLSWSSPRSLRRHPRHPISLVQPNLLTGM